MYEANREQAPVLRRERSRAASRWIRLSVMSASAWIAMACAGAAASGAGADSEPVMAMTPPTLVAQPRLPVYPAELLVRAGTLSPPTGRVVVEITVRVDGSVDSSTIAVVSATDSAFIPSVVASVAAWRFLPAEEGPVNRPRKPVEMRIALPVTVAPPARR
jgi:TonB family protein